MARYSKISRKLSKIILQSSQQPAKSLEAPIITAGGLYRYSTSGEQGIFKVKAVLYAAVAFMAASAHL
ncbi:MAG TPA: hypothetical protein DF774_05810 [Rheinheimera sp.]|nr:hypothetical protein [Rheinheimera sp.]